MSKVLTWEINQRNQLEGLNIGMASICTVAVSVCGFCDAWQLTAAIEFHAQE